MSGEFSELDAAAIPLVIVPDDGSSSVGAKFEINPEAIAYLQSIHSKVAVVAIAGLYRTGKSYLLNRIMGKTAGFNVGPTVKACTKGIWLWGKAMEVDGADYHVLFLDTEGLGSTIRGMSYDSRIFALAILLSSCFVYNSTGVIDGDAMSRLSLVVNLTKHIHVKATSTEEDSGVEFAQHFPSFLWVVRDFTVKLERQDGRRMSPHDYLEDALKPESGVSDATEQKNTVRNVIRSFFPERDCVTMIRPVTDESALNSLATLPDEAIRPEFLSQVEALRKRVFSIAKPKTMYGKSLTGPMFAVLVQEYCNAMNADKTPVIKNAWERVADSQCQDAADKAAATYKSELVRHYGSLTGSELQVYDEAELLRIHEKCLQEAEVLFRSIAIEDSESYVDCESAFRTDVATMFSTFQRKNASLSSELCERCYDELANTAVDSVKSAMSGGLAERTASMLASTVRSALQKFLDEYHGVAKGPSKNEVLFSRLVDTVGEMFANGANRVDECYKEKLAEQANQLVAAVQRGEDLATKLQHTEAEAAKRQSTLEQELSSLTASSTAEKERLSGLLALKTDELARTISTLESVSGSLEAQVTKAAAADAELRVCQHSLEEQRAANAKLTQQLADNTQEWAKKEEDWKAQLAQINQQMQQERVDHAASLEAVRSESTASRASLTEKHNADIAALTEQLTNLKTEAKVLAGKLETAESALDNKTEALRDTDAQRIGAEAKVTSLTEAMAAAKQYSDAMIRSLQEQVESLKTQHAQSTALSSEVASKEMAAVRKELSAAVEKCGSLQSMLDDRTTHLTEAQTQIAVLHERLASSNATATSTASELQRITVECAQYRTQAEANATQVRTLTDELGAVRRMAQEAQTELHVAKQEHDGDVATQLDAISKKLDVGASEGMSALEIVKALLNSVMSSLSTQSEFLSKQLEGRDAQIAALTEKLTASSVEIQSLKLTIESQERDTKALNDKVTGFDAERAQWQSKKRSLKTELESVRAELASVKESSGEDKEAMQLSLTAAQEDLIATRERLTVSEALVLDLQRQNGDLVLESASAQEVRATVERLTKENGDLQEHIAALTAEVNTLKQQQQQAPFSPGSTRVQQPTDDTDAPVGSPLSTTSSGGFNASHDVQRLTAALEHSQAQCAAIQTQFDMFRASADKQFAEAGVQIVNQEKALELLWSQKGELELELGQVKAALADCQTSKVAAEVEVNNLRRFARELKSSLLATGTRFSVKDPKVLEYFHSL